MTSFIGFLFGTSVWQLGAIISSIVVGSTLVTLILVDRFWHRELRRHHNDIAGFLIAVVGVIFAVLISSLAITVLTRQDRAEALVVQEAESLAAIDRESDLLPPAQRAMVHQGVDAYLQLVVDEEWPQMRRAERPTAAAASLDRLWSDVAALPVSNFSEMLSAQSLRKDLDRLSEARRGRTEIATSGVDPVIWTVVLFGSAATILSAVLFGVQNFISHMVMTGLLSFVVALAITMIVAIDWPYFGEDAIRPDRLAELQVCVVNRGATPHGTPYSRPAGNASAGQENRETRAVGSL